MITLIRPPGVFKKSELGLIAIPPLGLAYLAGALKAAGLTCTAIDAVGEAPDRITPDGFTGRLTLGLSEEEILRRIPSDVQIIGLGCAFTKEWPNYLKLIRAIRRKFPLVDIVCGGEHITAEPVFSMKASPEIDYCVLGEGEETVVELAHAILGNDFSAIESMPGIAYRKDGMIQLNARRPRNIAIDEIPRPDWDVFPIRKYLAEGRGFGVKKGPSMPILATRGCPFTCTFCSSPSMLTTRYVTREPAQVVAEMREYQRKYGATNFDFFDLTAIIKKDWILEFCRVVAPLRVTWQLPSGTRSEAIDQEVCEALLNSGCTNVSYSPESGSPSVLRRIKKKIDINKVEASIATAVRTGLNVKANMIFGFPGESHREIWQSLWRIVRLAWVGLHDFTLWTFAPYPGSELYQTLKSEGKIQEFDQEYLESISYSQLTQKRSWNDQMGILWINFYRSLGMVLFYTLNFGFRPWRVFRIFRNVWNGTHESRMDSFLSKWLGLENKLLKRY